MKENLVIIPTYNEIENIEAIIRKVMSLSEAFDVLILDEPTAGLDPIAVEVLKAKIKKEREEGKLILITSHILSDLEELTNRAIYIYEGEVFFSDTIEELKEITGESKFSPAIAKLMEWTLKKKSSKTQLSHV